MPIEFRPGSAKLLPAVSMILGVAVLVATAACSPGGVAGSAPSPDAHEGTATQQTAESTAGTRPVAKDSPTVAPTPAGETTNHETTNTATPKVPVGINVGQLAPDFALASLEGKQVRLSDFRGKTVLVNFWATWCPPCKEEMPALDDLYRKYNSQDFVVLAVNMAEDPGTVGAFVKKGGFSYPVLLDRGGDSAKTYQAISLPVSYIVGPDGIVEDRIIGAMTAPIMETKTRRFLAARTQGPAQPGSVAKMQQATSGEIVAYIGSEPITMGEINRQVDLSLALERLSTGAVLDPSRASDQAELKERQHYAVDQLINQRLLADAAKAAGLEPDRADVDEPVRELTSQAGGKDKLASELARNGVSLDDLQAYLQERALANAYVLQGLAKQPGARSMDEAVQQWLDAERTRRAVRVLGTAN